MELIKVLLVASLVCQFVGYISPGWFYLVFPKNSYRGSLAGVKVDGELKRKIMMSLWYVVACVDVDATCDAYLLSDMEERMQVFKRALVWPKVRTTLALIMCLIALIGVWKTTGVHITSKSRRIRAYITMMTSILSCTLSITTVTFVETWYWRVDSPKLDPVRFPFSLFFTGLGGIMAGVAFTINLVWRPWKVETLFRNTERVPAADNPGFTNNQPVVNPTPLSGGYENGLVVQQGQGDSVYPTQQTGNVYPMTNEHLVATTDP